MSIRIHSVIVGLHTTGNGSHPLIVLDVVEDNDVDKDPDCMRVVCNNVPTHHRKLVTWPANEEKNRPDQLAADIINMKIGNVPANLCGFLRRCEGIQKITAMSKTNRPVGVRGPRRAFQKMTMGQDQSGKGIELPCVYDIYLKDYSQLRQIETQIQQFLVTYNGNAWLECLQTRINEYIRARGGRSYYSDDEENDEDFDAPSVVKKRK